MAHDHHHYEDDTYWIDQLCMVGLSGAFGVICLLMYFGQSTMLGLLLGPQFHLFIVISGFTLVGLALIRATVLWKESGEQAKRMPLGLVTQPHTHEHDHNHHRHDHGPCTDPAHHHHGETCDHDHGEPDHAHHHHEHGSGHHGHDHHDHGPEDHDHGWAPWRYVVLLVPIILFLLGLPNKGPKAADYDAGKERLVEAVRESTQTAGLVGLDAWTRIGLVGKIAGDNDLGDDIPVDFKRLLNSVDDNSDREYLKDKTVTLRGQFVADARDPRFFALVRFKRECCAADAVDKRISVFSREPITEIPNNAWAAVTGKVEYGKRGDTIIMRLVTTGPKTVKKCDPDVNPFLQ